MRPDNSIREFVGSFDRFRTVFTKPTFWTFFIVALGWIMSPGRHAVTAALVATGTSGLRHHSAFHRFFSLARWSPDELGRHVFLWVVSLLDATAPIPLALDDTLASKKGAHVFGIGSHIDAVRSTKKTRVFCFGHVWVVLAVVIRQPFSRRPWALPVLFRLYRNKKECEHKDHQYWKKTELARQMLDVVAGWVEGRRCELSADSAYCNDTVTRGLTPNLVLFGCMRPDAALTAEPTAEDRKPRGRRRLRGKRLPTPEAVAQNKKRPWQMLTADLYRQLREVRYKLMVAQWYRACGPRLVKIVIVEVRNGNVPLRVFFCTDPTVSPQYLLERYASRWAIEVTFRDLKQLLGFSESQAWTRKAVERTAPFVGLLFSFVVLWYSYAGHGSRFDWFPVRPWYPTKVAPSFADMLAATQRAVIESRLFDPANDYDNLQDRIKRFFRRWKGAG